MDFKKYIKYKKKYLNLKNKINQYGGNELDEEIERLEDIRGKLIQKKKANPADKEEIQKEIIEIRYKINDTIERYRENILKPYDNCNKNSIEIDDFIFSLLAYDSTANDDRGILIIKSINKINNSEKLFPVYSSKSEGGFWRLCMTSKTGMLAKGDPNTMDYIQGTFIHIKLQQFINNNLDKCPQLEIGNKCFFTDDLLHVSYIFKHVINSDRDIKIDPFYKYSQENGNRSGAPYYGNWNINSRLLELSTKLRTLFEFQIKEHSIEGNYKKIYNIEGDLLSIDGIIIKCTFMNNIVLYMLKYKLNVKRKDASEYNKNGISPIIMTISCSKITEFGIYDQYISAGNYIGKLFEYDFQIAGSRTYQYESLGSKYTYIGHHYNGVYPYTEFY